MISLKKEETTMSKSNDGVICQTLTTFNGVDFKITTKKKESFIFSSYAKVQRLEGGGYKQTLSFLEEEVIIKEQLPYNERNLNRIHCKSLLMFDQLVKKLEVKKDAPIVGSVIFYDNLMKTKYSKDNEYVVYQIELTISGAVYRAVEISTLELKEFEVVRNFKSAKGIGVYFEEDYLFQGSQDDINNIVIEAMKQKKTKLLVEKAKKQRIEKEINAKIADGKSKFTIPSDAVSVIVADFYVDKSDSMADYFHTSADKSKRIYLAFSKTKRNNMKELEKASLNSEVTKDFLSEEGVVKYTSGHSFLPNYFIGTERWSGIKITKLKYFDLSKEENRNLIYIAVSEGRCFVSDNEKVTVKNNSKKQLEIIDYSDRSFAVIGEETKKYKDELKSLGGRFNYRLTCGAGWIFPKTKLESVKSFL